MKRNFIIIYSCLSIAFLFSCKKVTNFLDKAPGVDIDENTIFSSKVQLEQYVATMYQFGLPSPLPLRGESGVPVSANNTNASSITDEAEASESFSFTQNWNAGGINATNIIGNEDYRYSIRWQSIRIANIILERIGEVPDADQTYKDQVSGEALFIRAINNFEMFKRYGGFPLVMKRVTTIEESKIARSSLDSCVKAIVKDCDDAVAKLPVTQPSTFTGRANKGVALALKARTLLYAASPLFNTATPYLDFGGEDNKLICYGNYDKNRWKDAADAAKAVLDWAQSAGVALVDVPAKRIPRFAPGGIVDGNYRTAWGQNDNPETILANKAFGTAKANYQFPYQAVLVRSDYVANAAGFWVATSPTFNFVRKYEDTLGNVVNWNMAGGDDLLSIYGKLDPRFSQTVVYEGARLHNNATRVQIWQGALSNKSNCKGGNWLLKWVPDAIGTSNQIPYIPLFRLDEFYLSYAEATNEFNGPGSASVAPLTPAQIPAYVATYNYPAVPASPYDMVNKVRLRSGMPPLQAGLSQSDFRNKLHNERDIELAFEDHRFNDIRRWMVAEQDGVMQGDFFGLEINKLNSVTPFPTAFSYKPYVFETRTWQRREYLFPYDNNEVLKGNLKQNPGW